MTTSEEIILRDTFEDLDVQTSPPVTELGGDWTFRYEKKENRFSLRYNRHTDSGSWAVFIHEAQVELLWPDRKVVMYLHDNTDHLLTRNRTEAIINTAKLAPDYKIEGASVKMVIDVEGVFEILHESFNVLMDWRGQERIEERFENESYDAIWELAAFNDGRVFYVELKCLRDDQSRECFYVFTELMVNYDDPEKMEKEEHLHFYKIGQEEINEIGKFDEKSQPLKMKVKMIVLELSGIGKRKLQDSWKVKNVRESNAYFAAEGKMFSVNKRILAQHSPVFREIFSGKFFESSTRVFIIVDASQNDFQKFLSIIYSEDCAISESEAVVLLRLAERYDVEKVAEKAQDFLIYSSNKSVTAILKLTEKYNWDGVNRKVIGSLDMKALKELRENIEGLSFSTRMAIFDRALDLVPEEVNSLIDYDEITLV